jgi:hypothetical protein
MLRPTREQEAGENCIMRNLIICKLHRMFYDHKIKEVEMRMEGMRKVC